MRKFIPLILSVVGLSLLGVAETSAQIDLGKALGTLINEAQKVQQTPDHYAKLRANAPTKAKVLGSWHYLSARVEYLGINSLAQVAIPQLESFVLGELKRNGIVEGCCSLTLNRSGVAVIGTLDTIYEGNYSYDPATAKLKATYIYNSRHGFNGSASYFHRNLGSVLSSLFDNGSAVSLLFVGLFGELEGGKDLVISL